MQSTAVIIGAGVAGLACAMRLAHAGLSVTVLDRHGAVGGKMRTLPSPAGPVDAGPTVLTMRSVFDTLFRDVDARLEDYVTLRPAPVLARHWWPDGSSLDLVADRTQSAANVRAFAGAQAEREWLRFSETARRLFEAFEGPMMQAARPSALALTARVLREPSLIGAMAPLSTLTRKLSRSFSDPRLAQLYGRYATYVGGSPLASPAVLALIAEAEAQGVWAVDGGMHRLAAAMADLARSRGACFKLRTHVTRIEQQAGRVAAVHTADGRIPADIVVLNGDPRALRAGHFGKAMVGAVPQEAVEPRSLSARVWAFAAEPQGPRAAELAHHNVFFATDPQEEFRALAKGEIPQDPTIYVCAQDRAGPRSEGGLERFEIILNASPSDAATPSANDEAQSCQTHLLETLGRFGLGFLPEPDARAVTLPAGPTGFNSLFPATAGSLYGRSPHGMMAAFARPQARTAVPGLYLVGGGAHPGAGVPMATLSAKHGAEAILADQTSTSTFPQTAMRGGMSTA